MMLNYSDSTSLIDTKFLLQSCVLLSKYQNLFLVLNLLKLCLSVKIRFLSCTIAIPC